MAPRHQTCSLVMFSVLTLAYIASGFMTWRNSKMPAIPTPVFKGSAGSYQSPAPFN